MNMTPKIFDMHCSTRLTAASMVALVMSIPSPVWAAAPCQFQGSAVHGVEPRLMVDGECTDPDYNASTLVIDSTTEKTQVISASETIRYTEVKGHFPATRTRETLLPGTTGSPTLAQHGVTWRFPEPSRFQHRFFQNVYPIGGGFVDPVFAFTHGAYTVSIAPGTPSVGYRVDAAAAKLAKAYAHKIYGGNQRIYGYVYGLSGGSVQVMGAAEGTTGVWDGAMPISIATHSLSVHSFPWDGLYALAVPEAKRKLVAASVAPGSGVDIHAGLKPEESAALEELLKAGFSRRALENNPFNLAMTTILAGDLPKTDPTYVEDFWSKPGYEGTNPPPYLAAAKVDGFATVIRVNRDAQGVPVSLVLSPDSIPALGSIGDVGLNYDLYGPDGRTPVGGPSGGALVGTLKGDTFTFTKPAQGGFIPAGPPTDAAVLGAVVPGSKVRINNRFLLALCFYPRHTALDNGNAAYNQYRNADGSWKYPQRPVSIAFPTTASTAGGTFETGHIRFKTMIMENTVDPNSYPYVASFYHAQIRNALGPAQADRMARIYYNDNADHASFGPIRGNDASMLIGFGGIVQQALLDLAAWVEKDVAPPPSTSFTIVGYNQIALASKASERQGLQPVVTLTANGAVRAEVQVGQAVRLSGRISMPPQRGKVMQYDWYVGDTSPVAFQTPVVLSTPKAEVEVSRSVSFSRPGSFFVTLRASAQRTGKLDPSTSLDNLARVRVVVLAKPGSSRDSAPTDQAVKEGGGYSVELTPIGTLLDDPAAKAVLTHQAPELASSDSLSAWRNLTLRAVQKLVGQSLRDAQLEAIQADFDKLPNQSRSGDR